MRIPGITGGYQIIFICGILSYIIAFACILAARPARLPKRAAAEGFVDKMHSVAP